MCYTYDELSRVTRRVIKSECGETISNESYSYDAAGNVTDAPNNCFVYDTNNRLTVFNGNSVLYDTIESFVDHSMDTVIKELGGTP